MNIILALQVEGTTDHPLIVRAKAVNTYASGIVDSLWFSSLTPNLSL